MKLLPLNTVHIDELLDKMAQAGCRELRLRIGQSPLTRSCHGAESASLAYEAPSPLDIQQMVYAILTDEQIRQFEREGKISFSYSLARRAAFEVHVVRSQGVLEADFIAAPDKNPSGIA